MKKKTLKEEIQAIVGDHSLDYDAKAKLLSKIVSGAELQRLLPKPSNLPVLKDPITYDKPKVLNLSLKAVYFDQILRGTKTIEYRDYQNSYYVDKCTYEEDGKKYLVPFNTIVFHQGQQRSMTVQVTNITCNGIYLMYHLGKILYKPPAVPVQG